MSDHDTPYVECNWCGAVVFIEHDDWEDDAELQALLPEGWIAFDEFTPYDIENFSQGQYETLVTCPRCARR